MTEPFDPAEPAATAFSATLGRPRFLRVAVVGAASIVLLVSAALALAASPAPSGAGPNAANPGDPGKPGRGLLPGLFGGPGLGGLDLKDGRGGGPGFGQISIASINGSNLGLKTDDGWTRTIAVTADTKITKGGATIALGDLKVGDAIRFRETRNADGSYAINAIQVVVPQVAGTVTAVTADGFTLTSRKNTKWTITVNGTTSYVVGGAVGSKSEVTVGATVGVAGTQTGDSALTAITVRVEPARVVGKVTAKTADTITVERVGGGTATIHVGSGTTYKIRGDSTPSLSDIGVGTIVGAQGRQRADGSLDATIVQAGPKAGKWFGGGKAPKAPKASPATGSTG